MKNGKIQFFENKKFAQRGMRKKRNVYLAGVYVRRIEDTTEAIWSSKVFLVTISELNKKAYVHIEDWRNYPLQGGKYPYVYVDCIYLQRNWSGEFENVTIAIYYLSFPVPWQILWLKCSWQYMLRRVKKLLVKRPELWLMNCAL